MYNDPKTGEIYQKPKGGIGYGEPIGYNVNDFVHTATNVGIGVAIGLGIYEVVKWGVAIIAAPETLGSSLVGAAALP